MKSHSVMVFVDLCFVYEKQYYRMMLSMSKQISPPKISSILQKNDNWPKKQRPFHTKAFNCEQVLPIKPVGHLLAVCQPSVG